MEAHVLLADAAQSMPDGKVHALGLGWSNIPTPLPAHAVVIFIKVPWDQTNRQHSMNIELIDADGQAVTVPGPVGDQALKLEGQFEAGRPAGVEPGTPMDMALTFNLAQGLPLGPGRHTWVLTINEDTKDDWRASFTVRPTGRAPSGPGKD